MTTMKCNIPKEYQPKINSIMAEVPQSPFVIDILGRAVDICYETYKDNLDKFGDLLDLAIETAKFLSEGKSEASQTLFKYHLVAACLLVGVPADKYTTLDTASGTVKDATTLLTGIIFNNGWKQTWLTVNEIVKYDMDLLYPVLIVLKDAADKVASNENPTVTDKYILAGLAYLEVSLRTSNITVPNKMYPTYNKFMNIMMKKADF